MDSQACSVLDIASAFEAAERGDFLGPNRSWNSINPHQAEFFRIFGSIRHLIPQLMADGLIDHEISWDAPVVNKWLARKGFPMELTDQHNPDYFYVGSVYRQLIKWLVPGTALDLVATNGRTYPGALLESGLSFYESRQGLVAAVATEGNDVAYFMRMAYPDPGPFGLMKNAMAIQKQLTPVYKYGELLFPMVDLEVTTDVNWLVGANTVSQSGKNAKVAQAIQMSRLKLNQFAGLAESGFAMSMLMEAAFIRERMVINSPFLFWIDRPGVPIPMFTAWIKPDAWKNPGEIK